MSEGINLEEKMYELATLVASCAATNKATAEALATHEKVCADRYGWVLKVVIGSAGATFTAITGLCILLFDKAL